MKKILVLVLALICAPAFAEPLCGLPWSQFMGGRFEWGYSNAGQWLIRWDELEDTGEFVVDADGTQRFIRTRNWCLMAGKKVSLATIGTRLQSIRAAADPQAAAVAAWAQYISTPFDDPSLALVRADLKARGCPKLSPPLPQVCR